MNRRLSLVVLLTILYSTTYGQFLMDMIDTTKETGRGMLGVYKKFDHLRIGGYIQPQYQLAEEKGIKSFEGGDFGARVSNRFMLRRSRVRIDYVHFGNGHAPGVQIVFQFDANERGFTMRDVWGRIFENRWQLFSFTTGMFARPFGFEVNLSSSDRESPERGRMSQILMRSERDLGAMVSFDARRKGHKLQYLKIDAGMFNGQGINASGEFDNTKDFIGR
ncbi:MAG: porin, partial [Dinghuibacter sp.]|nr:porin [Dinghuibacter sp.]